MSSFSTAAVRGAPNSMATAPRKRINLRTAFIIQPEGQRKKWRHVSRCTTLVDKLKGHIAKVESLTRIVSFYESITNRCQSCQKVLHGTHFERASASRWAQPCDQRCPTARKGVSMASHPLLVDYSHGTGCCARLRKRQLPPGGALAAPRKWRKSGS